MNLTEAEHIYIYWTLEREPSDELQSWLDAALEEPNNSSYVHFATTIIEGFSIEKGTYWFDWAVTYLWRSSEVPERVSILEDILRNYSKFGDAGASLNRVATVLGDIAPYPNAVLRSWIEFEPSKGLTDWEYTSLQQLQAAAYGGYIMTATDFRTGLEAGRGIKSSGERPTVAQAERVIKEWQRRQR